MHECKTVTLRTRPLKKNMLSFYLDYYPGYRDKESMKVIRHESLGIYIYAYPKNQREQNFNAVMSEKAEAIRCRRFESIVNERYDFFDKSKMKGDFLAYYKKTLRKHDQKWEFVYLHFCNFVGGKCSFEEIDVDLCNKFREYLLRSNQPVNFKFEGVEYSITIEEVAVFPQGYAALMTEVGLLQDEPSMLLMDLGGWTVDLMRIDNAIPAADTAHSLELGMIRCVDDIREQVRRETGLSLTDAQIENMLAGQPCTVSDTVRDIVNRQGRKYTEHLLSATMEAGFDLHAIPAVLLGGGASVVSRHLSPKDGLCKTIFLLDDKVNAVGFERALAAVSRRKSEA